MDAGRKDKERVRPKQLLSSVPYFGTLSVRQPKAGTATLRVLVGLDALQQRAPNQPKFKAAKT